MYLLKKDNVRKIVSTEAKRDALIALGYTVIPDPEKRQTKLPDKAQEETEGK